MTWKELLVANNMTDELKFIEENQINMSTVQEIMDSEIDKTGLYKFKPFREIAKQRKALVRIEDLLSIYREGYDFTQ